MIFIHILFSIVLIEISYILYLLGFRMKNKFSSRHKTGEYLVCLIINKSLRMSTGKTIAQIGHALFNVIAKIYSNKDLYNSWSESKKCINIYEGSAEEIKDICILLHKYSIKYSKIIDAGRTQIPSGSNTILIVYPTVKDKITAIIEHLTLYN